MLGSIGLWRPATRRSRSEWPVSLASFLLLLCATTLLAATTLYADTIAQGGVTRAILDAPPASRAVLIRASTSAELAADADATVRDILGATLAPATSSVARVDRVVTSQPTVIDDGDVRERVAVAAFEGIADHADVLEGRWPDPDASPVEAAIPTAAAERLGLTVGDELTLNPVADGGVPLELRIVGRWEPRSRDDPYWLADPLELDGVLDTSTERTVGPLIVTASDLVGRIAGDRLTVQWRAVPDASTFPPEGLAEIGAAVTSLDSTLEGALPDGPTLTARSGLPDVLATVERSVLVSRSGILLLTIQFAVLAGYAVLLVAGMLAERRRTEVALLSARGASTTHLTLIAVLEGTLLAIPAAVLAPFLAYGIVSLIGTIGPLADVGVVGPVTLSGDVFAISGVASAAYLAALVLPAITAGLSVAGVRTAIGRQVGRTLPQRLGIDLALVLVAVIALWQLRLYGAPLTADVRGTLGIDPLLVAAPAIGLIAGAVLATRLIPRLGEIGERLTWRRRSLVGPLSARQVARRPLRYTRSALLLMLAAALGTFAIAQAATWTRSQEDQAAYQAAADIRLVAPEYDRTPPWLVGDALRGVDGVAAAMPVVRQVLDAGRAVRGAELLGLEPDRAAALLRPAAGRDPDLPELLGRLTTARPTIPTIPIDGDPVAIAVDLTPDVRWQYELFPGATDIDDWPGIAVTAVIVDGDGRTERIELERGLLGGGPQRLVGSLRSTFDGRVVGPTGPLSLVAVEVGLTSPLYASLIGTVDIRSVATSSDGTTWEDLPFDPGSTGWAWTWSGQGTTDAVYTPPGGRPGRMVLGVEPSPVPPFSSGEGRVSFRLRATPAEEAPVIPALVGGSFIAATGAEVGDRLAATSLGQDVTLEVVGVVDTFAPLDPDVPFAVVDAPTLERWRFETTGGAPTPQEWWFAVDPDRGPDVAAALADSPYRPAAVIERATLAAALANDPILLGVIGALGLGALAALAFAAIGIVVSAVISASERLGEFALLRALGLSAGGLTRWLTLETAFLLLTGLTAGCALGLLLAWVVLPVSTLTPTGETPVPPPEVVVPWEAVVPLMLAAGLLLVVAVRLAVRQLPGVRVSGVLRAWEG